MNKKGLGLVFADFVNTSKIDSQKTNSFISIVLCNKSSTVPDIIHAFYGQDGSFLIKVNKDTKSDDLLQYMFPQKKPIFLIVKEVINESMYLFLKSVSEKKQLAFNNKEGNLVSLPVSTENHLFIISKREILENQHNNIMNLSINILDLDNLL